MRQIAKDQDKGKVKKKGRPSLDADPLHGLPWKKTQEEPWMQEVTWKDTTGLAHTLQLQGYEMACSIHDELGELFGSDLGRECGALRDAYKSAFFDNTLSGLPTSVRQLARIEFKEAMLDILDAYERGERPKNVTPGALEFKTDRDRALAKIERHCFEYGGNIGMLRDQILNNTVSELEAYAVPYVKEEGLDSFLEKAGLDFAATVKPAMIEYDGIDGQIHHEPHPEWVWITRNDVEGAAGILGVALKSYTIQQYSDVIKGVLEVAHYLGSEDVRALAQDGGKHMYATIRAPMTETIDGEQVTAVIQCTSSHDRSTAITWSLAGVLGTGQQIFQIDIARNATMKIRHTSGSTEAFNTSKQKALDAASALKTFAANAMEMSKKPITNPELVYPDIQRAVWSKANTPLNEDRMARVRTLVSHAASERHRDYGTYWDLYVAVARTIAATHQERKEGNSLWAQTAKGTISVTISKAWDHIRKMAELGDPQMAMEGNSLTPQIGKVVPASKPLPPELRDVEVVSDWDIGMVDSAIPGLDIASYTHPEYPLPQNEALRS